MIVVAAIWILVEAVEKWLAGSAIGAFGGAATLLLLAAGLRKTQPFAHFSRLNASTW